MGKFFHSSHTITKLATLVMLFMISFSLYGLYCYNTVSEVKINGPFYQRIVQGKDVIADILPPPEYLIETYLTAFQMLDDKTGQDLPASIEKMKRLKADYLKRHDFWEKDLPEDSLKSALVKDSYIPAIRLLDTIEKVFIPALQAGDRAKADDVLHGSIQKDYVDHRAKIDAVVKLAVQRNKEDEARAGVSVQSRTVGQITLGLCLFILLSTLSWYLVNQIEESISKALLAKAVTNKGKPDDKSVEEATEPKKNERKKSEA